MKKLSVRKPAIKKPAKKNRKSLSFKQTISLLVLSSVTLFGASAYYWYKNILTDPSRTLSAMLDKSMQVTSVSRTVTQPSQSGNVNQNVYLSFTPQTAALTRTNLNQQSATGNTNVVTETLGTKKDDYVRYTSISVQNNPKNNDYNSVLYQWAKRPGDPQNGQPVSVLNDVLFVAVPFGNLNTNQRKDVKDTISRVGLYNKYTAEVTYDGWRPVINYKMNIEPTALVEVLAKYLQITNAGDASQLNPASYQGSTAVKVNIKVDAISRHIKTIEFADTQRTEIYTAYSLNRKIDIPAKTMSIQEFQEKLSKFQ